MRFLGMMLIGLATACAANPGTSAPAPLSEPAGVYDFTTELQGQVIRGTVTITGTAGAYGGDVTTEISEPIPVTSVTVAEGTMTVVAQAPDGPVTLVFTFEGMEFVAAWTYQGQSGVARGSKRAK